MPHLELPVGILTPIPPQTQLSDTQGPLTVTHWHFLGWPDHGVPQFATSLISFIRQVRKAHRKGGPPMLVHCSAGVGRTGAFIMLDSMLEKLTVENSINVYEFLCNMRSKRVFMVQTLVSVALSGVPAVMAPCAPSGSVCLHPRCPG